MNYFRKLYGNGLKFSPTLGIVLILLFGIPRFLAVMWANEQGDYRFTSIIFVVMWFMPFLLLNKEGRREIGLKRPAKNLWIYLALPVGILFSAFVWFAGDRLFGDEISNWLVYISRSYQLPETPADAQQYFIYFLIFAGTSMVFSPIGEEFLYRGIIHRCFSEKLGDKKASYVDSWAFALTHLAHFGLVYEAGSWDFLIWPALIWVALMQRASRLFHGCKKGANSIWAAVLAHAGFNLAMTYFIFYHIFAPIG